MNIRRLHSQVKIAGTIVTVGGAMIMTLVRGPTISLPWTSADANIQSTTAANPQPQDPIKGALMISAGCFCWASFYTLQVGFYYQKTQELHHYQNFNFIKVMLGDQQLFTKFRRKSTFQEVIKFSVFWHRTTLSQSP